MAKAIFEKNNLVRGIADYFFEPYGKATAKIKKSNPRYMLERSLRDIKKLEEFYKDKKYKVIPTAMIKSDIVQHRSFCLF